MIDEPDSILGQAQAAAKELTATATTDGQRVDGEVAFTGSGQSWAAKLWARVTARRGAKPDVGAGVEVTRKW